MGNSKATILGHHEGFIKVVTDEKFGEILGVHIIGPLATEIIAESVAALQLEATVDDLMSTVHAHPTVWEAMSRRGGGGARAVDQCVEGSRELRVQSADEHFDAMKECADRRSRACGIWRGMGVAAASCGTRARPAQLPDVLLLCEHPHVITLGRNGKLANLRASGHVLRQMGVSFFETDRGGDITYHGPGQLVGYPILNLAEIRRDVGWYVRSLEEAMIRATAEFGVSVAARCRTDGSVGGRAG